jgi:hypothetical protein
MNADKDKKELQSWPYELGSQKVRKSEDYCVLDPEFPGSSINLLLVLQGFPSAVFFLSSA